jgi:hypothetical protein
VAHIVTTGFYKVKVFMYNKVKLSCYMPWKCLGGEEVQLLLILDLGIRWE